MSGKGLARYLLLTRFQPLPIGTFQLPTLRQEKPAATRGYLKEL